MDTAIAQWKAWLTEPFSPNASVLDWACLTIFAATLSYLWTKVLEAMLSIEA